jgi:hypothetical protein
LKKIFIISLFIISLASLAVSVYILLTLNQSKGNSQIQNPVKVSEVTDTSLVNNNQEVILPDYVPPQNGADNKLWRGNRHRFLLKDKNCYFGNGMKYRHRWGQKSQGRDSN